MATFGGGRGPGTDVQINIEMIIDSVLGIQQPTSRLDTSDTFRVLTWPLAIDKPSDFLPMFKTQSILLFVGFTIVLRIPDILAQQATLELHKSRRREADDRWFFSGLYSSEWRG